MPRGPRLDHPGALHHVIARGIAREDIFTDDRDRRAFVKALGRLCVESGVRCLAWALMSNHYHLLVETGSTPISRVVHRLNLRHALRFNRRHDRVGHVFQNRFRSLRVEDDAYLFRLVGYIHRNPVEAGLVDLDGLDEYDWTGHAALMGRRSNRFQDVDGVLALFGRSRGEGRAEMRRFVAALEADGETASPSAPSAIDLPRRAQSDGRAFNVVGLRGRSDFLERVVRELDARDARRAVLRNGGWTLERLLTTVCGALGADEESVRTGRRTARESRARAIVAYLAWERLGERQSDVARRLGVGAPALVGCVSRGKALCDAMPRRGEEFLS